MRVPNQIKIKCGLFMNQECQFMDQEWLCIPWPAPNLCVRQQLFDLAAPWAGKALLLAVPKVGMQGFLWFLTWIQNPFPGTRSAASPALTSTAQNFTLTPEGD